MWERYCTTYHFNIFEYSGPIILHLWLSSGLPNECWEKTLLSFMWILHFTKRLLENQFVHKSSPAYKSLVDLFINCSYYWLFTIWITTSINAKACQEFFFKNTSIFYSSIFIWFIAEYGNLSIHLAYNKMKTTPTSERQMPQPNPDIFMSKMFNLVSCPNYTFESLGWLMFSMLSGVTASWGFWLIGTAIMASWARDRHEKYRQQFKKYPSNRTAILPFVF